MTRIHNVSLLLVLFVVILYPFSVHAQNKIIKIRHWAAPDHTRVVIDASDAIPYTIEKSDKKLSIDFKNAEVPEDLPNEFILKKPGIDKIVVTPRPDGIIRVELSIDANVETKVFNIQKIQDKPYRIVIDIEFPEVEKQETKEREEVKVLRKNKIVVIDPGHGGEDPGAVGKLRTQEKKVVLEISRKLRDILNKKDGYRAFLTRDGDYYVPFKKRMKIAREYGADLFVSIHADAFRRRGARGSSVYCLSLGGAGSEAAKLLARNENLADIIGGSSNGDNSDESDPIILNMFQTNTINSSKIFGSRVIKNLRRVNHIKYNNVQEAPFIVLKLPEVPSLLVETAYISNPGEEKLLKNNRFQTDIAKAITVAITEFLPVEPMKPQTTPKIIVTKKEVKKKSPDTPDESAKMKMRTAVYTVEKGDTLETIANKYNTKISALLKMNHMNLDDPLYFGRSLKVPVQEKDITEKKKDEEGKASATAVESPPSTPAPQLIVHKENRGEEVKSLPAGATDSSPKPEPAVRVYKVKKGDTLDKIAKWNNTSIGALLKLNNMKIKEPLHVGRKLKLSTSEKEIKEEKKAEAVKTISDAAEAPSSKTDPVVSVYKTKKGDTLDKIARRHNTTIGALLKLNNMKMKEPLYVGRNLKVLTPDKEITERKTERAVKASSAVAATTPSMPEPVVSEYKVKRGDTLEKIASKFNTRISILLKMNNMKGKEPLHAGRKIKVPNAEGEAGDVKKSVVAKSKIHTYRVKKGDTLEKIALKYKISISELRRINKMKRADVLYVDQKLKLPSKP